MGNSVFSRMSLFSYNIVVVLHSGKIPTAGAEFFLFFLHRIPLYVLITFCSPAPTALSVCTTVT